jgi:hypothetical protein
MAMRMIQDTLQANDDIEPSGNGTEIENEVETGSEKEDERLRGKTQ